MLAGCSKTETVPTLANQEKLWKMTAASEKVNEPVDLAYAKNTPAFYRDASFGKGRSQLQTQNGGWVKLNADSPEANQTRTT